MLLKAPILTVPSKFSRTFKISSPETQYNRQLIVQILCGADRLVFLCKTWFLTQLLFPFCLTRKRRANLAY